MTTQSRAARAAAETLREIEDSLTFEPYQISLTLDSYTGPEGIYIRQEVSVYRKDDGSLRYYETDGWGNLQFSTRESVLRRIELAFEKGREISE